MGAASRGVRISDSYAWLSVYLGLELEFCELRLLRVQVLSAFIAWSGGGDTVRI